MGLRKPQPEMQALTLAVKCAVKPVLPSVTFGITSSLRSSAGLLLKQGQLVVKNLNIPMAA
jgi:hypothetical protein